MQEEMLNSTEVEAKPSAEISHMQTIVVKSLWQTSQLVMNSF